MILTLDNTRLRELLPNIIHEVRGESSLYDKILPWLTSARLWLEQNLLGEFEPQDALYELAEKIIVYKAFALAVPSLDVTLSPAGFAVINTEGRAPASKERVERLVASLSSFVDANLVVLSRELLKSPAWCASPIGVWFRSTFIPDLSDVHRFRGEDDMLTAYRKMRRIALDFEYGLAERYLGREFLKYIRKSFPSGSDAHRDIFEMIHAAELRYIDSHFADTGIPCPDEHEIWHLVRPVIARLNYWPELRSRWSAEMGEIIKVEPFRNNVRGGYFF